MAETSQSVALKLSLVEYVEYIGSVKNSAIQQAPEIERDKFSFSLSPLSAPGPKMHIQSWHAQREREPLRTVIISCMCKLFL